MKKPLQACRFYERDRIGRIREIRWDEYLLTVDAITKRPDHPYYQDRTLIKLDPGVDLVSAGLLPVIS